MSNKRGLGIITFYFLLAVFVAVWALFLGEWLAQIGADAIATNSLSGVEAFVWGNLNLWVLLGVLGAGAGALFLAGGQQ